MSPTEFIDFLNRYCREQIKGELGQREYLRGKDEAYRDILVTIKVFNAEHNTGEPA